MDKGAALNRRVWSLFEKAGFQTNPSSTSTAEHNVQLSSQKKIPVDLYARDEHLGVTIIGSNKSGKLGRWTEHVNNYEQLGRTAGANKVLFVITGTELPDTEKHFAVHKGMCVWGEEELSYYEAVTEAIKDNAKYEIIHSLGIKTREEKHIHRVLAIRLRQPIASSSTELFLFTLPPEHLLKTSVIYRRAQGNASAYQRMLRKNRLPRIRKFVSGPDAILPTDIIVHLSDTVTIDAVRADEFLDEGGRPLTLSRSSNYDLVVLNIPMEFASLELIDGQHRLYGFVGADAATKREVSLVVLGVAGLTGKQKRDTFVAINDNSRRMDPNLVSFLKYTTNDSECQKDSELMAIRIVVDMNKASPFKKAIRLLDISGSQRLTLKGFSGYDLRGLLGPRGLLRRHYPTNTADDYIKALRMYFAAIRSLFGTQWNDTDKYIIATNRGVSAFLKLLKSILKNHKGTITYDVFKKYLMPLKSRKIRWEYSKLQQAYVGSKGWKDFHRDLVKAIRAKYPEFEE
ncbi:MAG: DGQHR domain-containing protein [Terriglobales bacterium]